jgi:hypothetical protein
MRYPMAVCDIIPEKKQICHTNLRIILLYGRFGRFVLRKSTAKEAEIR